jgi:hypothetical protein
MPRAVAVLAVLALAVLLGAGAARPYVEQRIAGEVVRLAADAGVRLGAVRFRWREPLRVHDVVVDRADTGRVEIAEAEVRWDYAGGRDPRAHVRGFDLRGVRMQRGPLTVETDAAAFDVVSWTVTDGVERLRLRQRPQGGEFEARWKSGGGAPSGGISMDRLDLTASLARWAGEPVLRPGSWSGRIDVTLEDTHLATRGDLAGQEVRLAVPASAAGGDGDFGSPVAVRLAWDALRAAGVLDVRRLDARIGGLQFEGRGRVEGTGDDATVDATASARTDLGAAFGATGIALPASLDVRQALGTAWVDLSVRGPLERPAELQVAPKLRFEPGAHAVEALRFLSRPFRVRPAGAAAPIVVRAGEPDFIPIGAVPPLFVDALLVSEDAGFYGHPGVDVAEIPAAWAANAERGTFARGASTITQQLVKNLFLSGEKTVARKLEEAALALMVDAALTKPRILEIYVNVIEWGPGIRGLVPAARHYFAKTPAQLTPKEIAFLVCLIPSPVRYHQAHTAGRAGPGMEQLTANLLAKLRSIGALADEAYAAALAEELRFAPETAVPAAASRAAVSPRWARSRHASPGRTPRTR